MLRLTGATVGENCVIASLRGPIIIIFRPLRLAMKLTGGPAAIRN
jgi:hypothetical protein